MARAFNKVLGANLEPIHEPPRPGDVRASLADIAAARQLLGYEPTVSFEDGLARTMDWYRWALQSGYGGWADKTR
jgi:UDP-glucose 4-epimerase